MEQHAALARSAGPLPVDGYRVVVSEPDGRWTIRDFTDLATARAFADDAASETENGVVLAWVFDERFRIAHVGTHY